jgi:ubiquinone/menaquinone biosynthesis C-methylase UbiE
MLREAARVLRPNGRFVLRNLCPQESADWLYYRYFPEAQRIDLRDFRPSDQIVGAMTAADFSTATTAYEHVRFEQDLAAWLEIVRRRDSGW